jgi:hypothetical protein
MFNETQISILKSLAQINPSQTIEPDGFRVIKNSKSVVATYDFDKAFDYEAFGIYDLPEFLSAVGAFKEPVLEMKPKFVLIKDGTQQIKYFTSPTVVMPKVPNISKKFDAVECELDFDLSADKLATIFKMAGILKSQFVFFESDKKKIRITITNTLESSDNMYEVQVKDGIRKNDLGDTVLKIPIDDMKQFPGDYTVQISSMKISKWVNLNGITYFIGCNIG